MIKKNRISRGEGEILDLKRKSSLFNADISIFPIIGLGEAVGEIENLDPIKKSVGIILPTLPSNKEKSSFVICQEFILAKFNTVLHNTIETVVTCIIAPSKNIITYKLLFSNSLSSFIRLMQYLLKVTVLESYYFPSDLKVIKKTYVTKRIKKVVSVPFSVT